MSDHLESLPTQPLTVPIAARPRRRWLRLLGLVCLGAIGVGLGLEAWRSGWRIDRLRSRSTIRLTTLAVDQGELAGTLVENGTLESESHSEVRCQVEALVGLTGGRGFVPLGPSRNSAGGVVGAPKLSARATAMARAGGGRAGTGPAMPVNVGGAAAGASAGGGTGLAPPPRPAIRSFNYPVPPYVPIRPRVSVAVAEKMGRVDPSMMMGGRGGGVFAEKPGSTRILEIVPEGTKARKGDVLCRLDSSKFEVERKSQEIRYLQAKTLVDQARTTLEVNEITLREYQDGVFPQDRQLLNQYLSSCRTDAERAGRALEWSREMAAKGLRSPNQVRADDLAMQQAEFRQRDAEHMLNRLINYTAPRLVRSLKAKIESIRADLLAQEAAFQLEADRLHRLDVAIANCTLRAPRDGVVVYYNPPNMWGRYESQVREGMTVREGQILIQLPDPGHMRVRARINESKVAQVEPGQRATISVDAFPDRLLSGTVTEVTPIPSSVGGPFSDVKIYYAIIRIDSGLNDGLRPGLSAEITFEVNPRRRVTRVPLTALRWVENQPFAAVARSSGEGASGPSWSWRPVELGQNDPEFAEVVSGLAPGDRVVAEPDQLPAPRPRHTTLDDGIAAVAG
ncbi:MAG: HlyD family efflux transporter periplasmic adaptor subunit [Isosphaeraceae bacterium]